MYLALRSVAKTVTLRLSKEKMKGENIFVIIKKQNENNSTYFLFKTPFLKSSVKKRKKKIILFSFFS